MTGSPQPGPGAGRACLSRWCCRGWIAVARGEQETAAQIVQQMRKSPVVSPRGIQADTQLALPVACLTTDLLLAQGDSAGALAATRTACAQRMDAEPRYLWPLLATGMRACVDAVPAHLPPEVRRPGAVCSRALERAAAAIPAPVGSVQQAHAAVFDAEALSCALLAARTGPPGMPPPRPGHRLGQPYPLAYALLRAAAAAAAAGDRDAAASRLQQAAEPPASSAPARCCNRSASWRGGRTSRSPGTSPAWARPCRSG